MPDDRQGVDLPGFFGPTNAGQEEWPTARIAHTSDEVHKPDSCTVCGALSAPNKCCVDEEIRAALASWVGYNSGALAEAFRSCVPVALWLSLGIIQ